MTATISAAARHELYEPDQEYIGESFLQIPLDDDEDSDTREPPSAIPSFLDLSGPAPQTQTQHIYLTGKPGAGKSTFIKQLILKYGSTEDVECLKRATRTAAYLRLISALQQALRNTHDHRARLWKLRLTPLLALESSLTSRLETCCNILYMPYDPTSMEKSSKLEGMDVVPHIVTALGGDVQAVLSTCGTHDAW